MAQFKYEVVVFIAVICAVRAAVTVNIYGDDVDMVKEKKAYKVEVCDPTNCDRICQMLGFKFGVCRGDDCQCSSFAKDDDQLQSNDIPSLDEATAGTGLSGCNPSACDQLCRRLKFPGGVCVNGRCKCDNYRQGSDQLQSNDIPSLDEATPGTGLSGCNPSACDQLCRRLKFPGGLCVNGRCKCDNFRQGSDQLQSNDIPSLDEATSGTGLSGCNPSACEQLCRRLKFPGGVCVNGRCKCDNYRQGSENQIAAATVDACNANACSQICHRLGFRYGVCIGDMCRCSNMHINALALVDEDKKEVNDNSLQNDVETVPTNAALACDQLACMTDCTEQGFPGGKCFLGKCRCNKRDNEEKSSRGFQDCNDVNCYFQCVRMGYMSGRCLGGRCLCA